MKKFIEKVISLFINWLGCLKVCFPPWKHTFFEFTLYKQDKCLNINKK
jgi:hypothetical protein